MMVRLPDGTPSVTTSTSNTPHHHPRRDVSKELKVDGGHGQDCRCTEGATCFNYGSLGRVVIQESGFCRPSGV